MRICMRLCIIVLAVYAIEVTNRRERINDIEMNKIREVKLMSYMHCTFDVYEIILHQMFDFLNNVLVNATNPTEKNQL